LLENQVLYEQVFAHMIIAILKFAACFSAAGFGGRESASSTPVEGRFCCKNLLNYSF
jgi:hypothetical protein